MFAKSPHIRHYHQPAHCDLCLARTNYIIRHGNSINNNHLAVSGHYCDATTGHCVNCVHWPVFVFTPGLTFILTRSVRKSV